jgi:hypothetical protein
MLCNRSYLPRFQQAQSQDRGAGRGLVATFVLLTRLRQGGTMVETRDGVRITLVVADHA